MAGTTNESNRELGPSWTSWSNFNLGQILLPVLCAAFIATVILVIACCLIKKKSKPLRGWRERSCHTIETSHDMSENGIYDVIDKVKASSKSKTSDRARRHDKLNSNCLLVSQNEINRSKSGSIFATALPVIPIVAGPQFDALLTPPLPPCTKHDWNKFDRTFPVNKDEIPTGQENQKSAAKAEEEGVYETLDRYWTQSHSLKKELTSQLTEVNGTDAGADEAKTAPIKIGSNAVMERDLIKVEEPKNLLGVEKPANDKIICQLTLYHISDSDETSRQAESVYYYLNLQSPTDSHGGYLPSVLQNARLQVVPDEEVIQKTTAGPNITLEPVEGALVPKINESGTPSNSVYEAGDKRRAPFARMNSKDKEAPSKPSSKRTPILLVKKSESFRDANSELQAVKDNYLNHRRQSDSSNPRSPRTSTSSSTSGSAADKILKKLGPLPPVPQSHSALCRTESDVTGYVKHADGVTSREKHIAKNASRPLPLSPDQTSDKGQRLERSLSDATFRRSQPLRQVSHEPTFHSFKKDSSTNTSLNEAPLQKDSNDGPRDDPQYSHYFVLESSDYSSGSEDTADERYLE
ncbi:hypothetical protein Btru_071942 [Bulinus truncatus]|nr:hypothetical protein Btru_071942 [Bulinus truncatus]